jgi:hypothetical protein
MDLLGFIGAAKKALEYTKAIPGGEAPWLTDAIEFERHFGAPHEAFLEIVEHLSDEQRSLLEATLDVNPEAAVLWILAMDVVSQ